MPFNMLGSSTASQGSAKGKGRETEKKEAAFVGPVVNKEWMFGSPE